MRNEDDSLRNHVLALLDFPFSISVENNVRKIEPPTKEERAQASVNQLQYGQDTLKLLVAYKKAKLASKGIEWNCEVVRFNDLGPLLEKLANTKLQPGESKRIQIILQSMTHINNLDIEVYGTENGNHLSIAILDAINDGMTYQHAVKPFFQQLKQQYPNFIDQVFWSSEAIQHDELSCMMFAFKIASALQKEENFHPFLKTITSTDGEIKWSDLPLHFLKLCQSQTFLEQVAKKEHVPNETLIERFMRDFITALIEKKPAVKVFEKYEKEGADVTALMQEMLTTEDLRSTLKAALDNPSGQPTGAPDKVEKKVYPDARSAQINKKGETLEKYFQKHGAFYSNAPDKLHNIAAMDTFLKYSSDLKQALENITDEDLPKIIAGEMPFPLESVKPRIQNR